MMVDIKDFFQATNPSRTLAIADPEDKKLYIDFAAVRGGDIIQKLQKKITFLQPDKPSCALFTGHIGCGKSTELLRLKQSLEQEDFHVVYFESSEDLEMTDVDIADVLLAIAKRISESLEADKIQVKATGFRNLLQNVANILSSEITALKVTTPAGDVGFNQADQQLSLALGIGEITAKVKDDAGLRSRLNQFLGPKKTELLKMINEELIEPAIVNLKAQGKKGLVAIVDNLDRIDSRTKSWGRPQQEYLFVDQGEFLTRLKCHLIYTMPLSLKFSNDYGMLTQRFLEDPKVLPMVSVRLQDGTIYEAGLNLLKQMVLARAFPDLTEGDRLNQIHEIFESMDALDRLCLISGGHVRDLLRLLNEWIQEEMALPLSQKTLETVIRNRCNDMVLPISNEEWDLLRQVQQTHEVNDEQGYQKLIRSRFVFEYRNSEKVWFDVNPILAEAKQLKS